MACKYLIVINPGLLYMKMADCLWFINMHCEHIKAGMGTSFHTDTQSGTNNNSQLL